ncbi:hypothetical protein V1460_00965 [Streptomyces sp. SCSIO 30461]
MREDRAAFVEFCGGDELVLPPAEAEDLLNGNGAIDSSRRYVRSR